MSIPPSTSLPDAVKPVQLAGAHGPLAGLRADGSGGRAPVLLVPGYTGSKEDFLAVLAPLAAAGHDAMALDQRGQHDSPAAADPSHYALAALAEDVLAVARRLAASGVHLVGHSFGGLVARRAVLTDATAFRSLTLLSSGPAHIVGERAEATRLLLDVLPTHSLETIWGLMRALEAEQGVPSKPPEVERFLHERWVRNDPAQLLRFGEQLLAEPDRVEELAAVPLPKLVAYGAGDDAWPPRLQAAMAARLGAQHVVIPDALHSAAAENPAATVEVLAEFFAEVEGG